MSEMNESARLIEGPKLFDSLCSTLYLSVGFEQVKKNRGKPGIDGIVSHAKLLTTACSVAD
ncbi:MAG: hypothetical protein ABFS02_08255 [Pseudomonadota bacterium]